MQIFDSIGKIYYWLTSTNPRQIHARNTTSYPSFTFPAGHMSDDLLSIQVMAVMTRLDISLLRGGCGWQQPYTSANYTE